MSLVDMQLWYIENPQVSSAAKSGPRGKAPKGTHDTNGSFASHTRQDHMDCNMCPLAATPERAIRWPRLSSHSSAEESVGILSATMDAAATAQPWRMTDDPIPSFLAICRAVRRSLCRVLS